MADIHDVQELEALESLIHDVTDKVIEAQKKEVENEIAILQELKKHPGIKDSLSPKNKYIQLRTVTKEKWVEDLVDDWMRSVVEVKNLRKTLDQVQGKRDSVKKVFNARPEY